MIMEPQRIHLRIRLPHPAERVFEHLADHEGLPRWLGVERVDVRHHSPGGGAGTVRRVHLTLPGGLPSYLDEFIERFEPPRRISYSGKPGLLLRRYEGDLRFPATPDGCFLEWTIRLTTTLPGPDQALALHLRQLFREGLRRLEALLGPGPGLARSGSLCRAGGSCASAVGTPEEERQYARLLAEAQQACTEQFRRAVVLGAAGAVTDTRYWFLHSAALATSYLLDRVQSGCFLNPCWVLRVIIASARYLERNLSAAETPGGVVESHWQSWLRAMAHADQWWTTPIRRAVHSVTKGTVAHLTEDVPRALAEVAAWGQRQRLGWSWDALWPDWQAMAPAYDQVWGLLRPDLRLLLTAREQLRSALTPAAENELLLEQQLQGLPRLRQQAWERGQRLLNLVRAVGSFDAAGPGARERDELVAVPDGGEW